MTGYPGNPLEISPYKPDYPDFWSVVSKTLGACAPALPAHVALPRVRYPGSAYLGAGLDSFVVKDDPSKGDFRVPNLLVDSG